MSKDFDNFLEDYHKNKVGFTKNHLLIVLNEVWKTLEPVYVNDINNSMKIKNSFTFIGLKKRVKEIGVINNDSYLSIFALIATITDICIGERLAFVVGDGKDGSIDGQIEGFQWYKK